MFTQVSWSSYFTTILTLAAAYYLWIAFRYYRKDLVKIFAHRKFIGEESLSMDFQKPMLQSFSVEVRAFLFEAIRNNLNKEDIMRSIQMLIEKYPGVKDMTFRNSIEHLIIEESATSIHLNEQDLSELWN
jgi:hypothetical protein